MTEEQKEILIAKMLDTPSSLSNEELESIMHDPELTDIYEVSAAVSGACIRQPEMDVKDEWKRFRPRIRRKPTPMRWIMRVAAIFLGVIVLSNIVGNVIDRILTYGRPPSIADVESQAKPELQLPAQPETQRPTADNKIVSSTTVKSRKFAAAKQPPAKSADVESADIIPPDDIDIDEYLRVQQARIDNDLAMQVAKSYLEEYDDLIPLLDILGVYDASIDDAVREVTMQ